MLLQSAILATRGTGWETVSVRLQLTNKRERCCVKRVWY